MIDQTRAIEAPARRSAGGHSELTLVAGWYHAISFTVRALRLPLEPGTAAISGCPPRRCRAASPIRAPCSYRIWMEGWVIETHRITWPHCGLTRSDSLNFWTLY